MARHDAILIGGGVIGAAFDAWWHKLVQNEEVRALFDEFDDDGSGNINPDEVRRAPSAPSAAG